MRWQFHDLIIEGNADDATLWRGWLQSFSALPVSTAVPHLTVTFQTVIQVPKPPNRPPDFQQGDLLHYFVDEEQVIAHFPRYGQLHLDLAAGRTAGKVVAAAGKTYAILEDLIAISLSPHLRRRQKFLLHAFAAVYQGQAVLLVGGIGAGKTTTGLSLLNAGWQLLSNDSPIVVANGRIQQYPGVLAAYPESIAHFGSMKHLVDDFDGGNGRQKITVAAESIWPDVWLEEAPIHAICFPQIEERTTHGLTPLSPPAALARLLPHAVEQWDKAMIPAHLQILSQLVEAAPSFLLHLSPDVQRIPDLLQAQLFSE
ncbi:hypothetical protein [Candidatus Leptofilum sp.]|uniref:hypothetical protein n=1 Tax=Candidatus Leptofilum sp. TaxID=3241576 RepID=UPI003B5A0BCE